MKKIIKKFNNLIKNTIFKVQNKTNTNFTISNFNKYLITFISLLFLYIFYLLIPLLYDKTLVQSDIESKLLNKFKINVSTSADISYRILPAPHFLITDSKILVDDDGNQKSIAEIKNLKVFISQGSFFNQKKMLLKEVIINDANFSLLTDDLKLLNNSRTNQLSNDKITINNSNIFFKDNLDDIISIIKIEKAILFFDNEKLINLLNLNGEVFNIPFIFDFNYQNYPFKNEEIKFKTKYLKLNFFNKSGKQNDISTNGKNVLSFLNSKIRTTYNIEDKHIDFVSNNSRINNFPIDYSGELSFNPFDLVMGINLENYKISKLFYINSIIVEFFKSGLLFNDNISLKTSLTTNSNNKNEIFQNAKIILHIMNGKINFNNTKFINHEIGSLELNNSNLFLEDKKLVLNTNLLFDIKDSKKLFVFLNTNKSSRINIKNASVNLNYDFLSNQIKFNNVKINNKEVNDQLLSIIDEFTDNNVNNLNKSRLLLNRFFTLYKEEG